MHGPTYIDTLEILWSYIYIFYELSPPTRFFAIHSVFLDVMFRESVLDDYHVIQYYVVELNDHLTILEKPISALPKTYGGHSRVIHMMMFHWRHVHVQTARWRHNIRCERSFPTFLGFQGCFDSFFQECKSFTRLIL